MIRIRIRRGRAGGHAGWVGW